ncbi:glycosyltransferase family A protein [Actinoplanes teichomyceticus]|uniref:Galactosyltransferase-like protein n=1 Tax=Actinoplanes teichomyceticus TaxID=1867 RepID=A0A561WKQ5_ACTTI|nr:glycosyltransferase family A protein [Actinoplanes teichomyceticus]TWG24435.1 galactosyltransferase-like protein [Actinoplanes teichomyceticus]GIF12714.1 hypothetical protein Ate01nite_27460 [Actinoplanes teichomyceticus]
MRLGIARTLAGCVVAGADDGAEDYCPPYWRSSEPLFRRAHDVVAAVAARYAPVASGLAGVVSGGRPAAGYPPLVEALERYAREPGWSREHRDLAASIERSVRLLYFEGAPEPAVRPAPDRLAPAGALPALHVVIPFRAPRGSLRERNLRACLRSLAQQASGSSGFYVTVVESDDRPRHSWVGSWADNYVFEPQSGPFNKSSSVNFGARRSRSPRDVICELDADMVVDPWFITRVRVQAAVSPAFLPYEDVHCLDPESSARLVSERTAGAGTVAGYLLRRPPGGCVVVTAELFRAVDGFDTSFTGWGGEDRDFVDRLSAFSPVARSAATMIHLNHERPSMNRAAQFATGDREAVTQEVG